MAERVRKKESTIPPPAKLQQEPLQTPASSSNPPLLQSPVRTPSPKRAPPVKPLKQPKPKAKDPDKREMSLEEKHKLGIGLQSLPPENGTGGADHKEEEWAFEAGWGRWVFLTKALFTVAFFGHRMLVL